MADLLDIVPSLKTVKTSRGELCVKGLGLDGIAHLLKTRPQLLDFLKNGKLEDNVGFNQILDMGVDIVAAFLAAGLGHPGDEKAEKICREMNPEDAFNLGEAILKESFPSGPKAFFQRLNQIPGLEIQTTKIPAQTA